MGQLLKIVTPLLDEYHFLLGTIEVEGAILPVINLSLQLGYPQHDVEIQEYIIVNDGKSDWALAIEITDKIVTVGESKVELVSEHGSKLVSAFTDHGGSILTILNTTAICLENQKKASA